MADSSHETAIVNGRLAARTVVQAVGSAVSQTGQQVKRMRSTASAPGRQARQKPVVGAQVSIGRQRGGGHGHGV